MLDQRRRRWANMNTALDKRIVFDGIAHGAEKNIFLSFFMRKN